MPPGCAAPGMSADTASRGAADVKVLGVPEGCSSAGAGRASVKEALGGQESGVQREQRPSRYHALADSGSRLRGRVAVCCLWACRAESWTREPGSCRATGRSRCDVGSGEGPVVRERVRARS